MRLILIGCSHHTADVGFREALAFTAAEALRTLARLAADAGLQELLLLSTCNRTELLARHGATSGETAELPRRLIQALARAKGLPVPPAERFYVQRELAAVEHVFRVAAGLDSQVIGEPQILGQLKDAFRTACMAGTCGFLLNRLLHAAFRVGKRARTETAIGAGGVSLGLSAVELAQQLFPTPPAPAVLVLGAGQMARLVSRHLRQAGFTRLTVCNRTERQAAALAADVGGAWCGLPHLRQALTEHALVITASHSDQPLIGPEDLAGLPRPRHLIDLGVPRNVAPAAAAVPGVTVHDLETLRAVVSGNHERRRAEIPKVEAIVSEEVARFLNWHRSLTVKPTIVALLAKGEELRQRELARCAGRFSAEQRQAVDRLTKRLLQKLLHDPIMHLKDRQHHDFDHSEFWVATIRRVFDLPEATDHE